MLGILVAVCGSLLGDLSPDRVAGILDREATLVEGLVYKYLHTPKFPFLVAFSQENRLAAIALKPSCGDSHTTKTLRRKLQGSWHAYPLDIFPTGNPLPVVPTDQYQIDIHENIMAIDYGLVSQKLFFRSKAFGPVLVTWLYLPMMKDRAAFWKDNDIDRYIGNFLFINLGPLAISWRQTTTAHFGRVSFCIRLAE